MSEPLPTEMLAIVIDQFGGQEQLLTQGAIQLRIHDVLPLASRATQGKLLLQV